jgi:hypothetical protein
MSVRTAVIALLAAVLVAGIAAALGLLTADRDGGGGDREGRPHVYSMEHATFPPDVLARLKQ